jgi:hypothetical protein
MKHRVRFRVAYAESGVFHCLEGSENSTTYIENSTIRSMQYTTIATSSDLSFRYRGRKSCAIAKSLVSLDSANI